MRGSVAVQRGWTPMRRHGRTCGIGETMTTTLSCTVIPILAAIPGGVPTLLRRPSHTAVGAIRHFAAGVVFLRRRGRDPAASEERARDPTDLIGGGLGAAVDRLGGGGHRCPCLRSGRASPSRHRGTDRRGARRRGHAPGDGALPRRLSRVADPRGHDVTSIFESTCGSSSTGSSAIAAGRSEVRDRFAARRRRRFFAPSRAEAT